MFDVSTDAAGLPVVTWRESRLTPHHACFVEPDHSGALMFVISSGKPTSDAAVRFAEAAGPREYVLMLFDAGRNWRTQWPFLAALAVWIGLSWLIAVITDQKGAFIVALIVVPMIVGVLFAAIAVPIRLWRLRRGKPVAAGRIERWAWADLVGFRVGDERSLFGHVRRDNDGRELAPRPVVVADIGTARAPIEITSHFGVAAAAELHRVLTREFIGRREGLMLGYASGAHGNVYPLRPPLPDKL